MFILPPFGGCTWPLGRGQGLSFWDKKIIVSPCGPGKGLLTASPTLLDPALPSMEDWWPGTGPTSLQALHQLNPSHPGLCPSQRTAWGGKVQAETALQGGETVLSPIYTPTGRIKVRAPLPDPLALRRDYFPAWYIAWLWHTAKWQHRRTSPSHLQVKMAACCKNMTILNWYNSTSTLSP